MKPAHAIGKEGFRNDIAQDEKVDNLGSLFSPRLGKLAASEGANITVLPVKNGRQMALLLLNGNAIKGFISVYDRGNWVFHFNANVNFIYYALRIMKYINNNECMVLFCEFTMKCKFSVSTRCVTLTMATQ